MVVVFALVSMSACNEHNADPYFPTASSNAAVILTGGSTTLYPMFEALADTYQADHPNIKVHNVQSSSGKGISQLLAGDISIARVSRNLKPEELFAADESGLVLREYVVAHDALALIVHPRISEHLNTITQSQVHAIFFTGQLTDWSQLHPELDGPIHVYVRDDQSGTSVLFNQFVAGKSKVAYVDNARTMGFTPKVVESVASDPAGIAYASAALLDDTTVSVLAYGATHKEAVACNPETIRSAAYPMTRPLQVVTTSPLEPESARFISYILSETSQQLIAKLGLIPVRAQPLTMGSATKAGQP